MENHNQYAQYEYQYFNSIHVSTEYEFAVEIHSGYYAPPNFQITLYCKAYISHNILFSL